MCHFKITYIGELFLVNIGDCILSHTHSTGSEYFELSFQHSVTILIQKTVYLILYFISKVVYNERSTWRLWFNKVSVLSEVRVHLSTPVRVWAVGYLDNKQDCCCMSYNCLHQQYLFTPYKFNKKLSSYWQLNLRTCLIKWLLKLVNIYTLFQLSLYHRYRDPVWHFAKKNQKPVIILRCICDTSVLSYLTLLI